jgi:hypothetical protein
MELAEELHKITVAARKSKEIEEADLCNGEIAMLVKNMKAAASDGKTNLLIQCSLRKGTLIYLEKEKIQVKQEKSDRTGLSSWRLIWSNLDGE